MAYINKIFFFFGRDGKTLNITRLKESCTEYFWKIIVLGITLYFLKPI